MSQDINPNKSNNPWGKGSRGSVMKVVDPKKSSSLTPKTDDQLAKRTSLKLETKKEKAMKKTLEKSGRSSRERNLDAE